MLQESQKKVLLTSITLLFIMMKKIFILLVFFVSGAYAFAQTPVYNHLVDPRKYPDYSRRNFLAPTPEESFKDTVRFVGARNDIPETSRMFFGNFYRPNQSWIFKSTLELAKEITHMLEEGVGVFDAAGYGPGTPYTGSFGQKAISKNNMSQLERLGPLFIGNSLGEQDGRYWADMHSIMEPASKDPRVLHRNFLNYMRQNAKDYGYKLTQLTTWWGFHYLPKDGYISAVGSECHNKDRVSHIQLQQAFNRGVSRQYGLITFGDVSVFNTWGYKSYTTSGSNYGPTWGSSVSLMKRMMMLQYQSNAWILGFENEWGKKENPLPVGKVQRGIYNMVMNEFPQPGNVHVPVALLTDFFSGWMPPYHGSYKKWGILPYDRGNYFTHALFSLFYPNYELNGQDRNEKDAISRNSLGDVDAVLSDIHAELMLQYPVIIAADSLMTDMSIMREKIQTYVAAGGTFVMTANNAQNLLADVSFDAYQVANPGSNVIYGDQSIRETSSFRYCSTSLTGTPIASINGTPLAIEVSEGEGKYIILLSDFGMHKSSTPAMLNHTKEIISDLCRKYQLFTADGNATCMVNSLNNNTYLVGIYNNTLEQQSFGLKSQIGDITSIEEVNLGEDLTEEIGYTPQGIKIDFGSNSNNSIRALDVRLFKVTVNKPTITEAKEISYPHRPINKYLSVKELLKVKDQISEWPHFFHYFSGLKLNWTSIANVDNKALKEAAEWINHQKLDIIVDFSSDFQLMDFRPENIVLYNQLSSKIKHVTDNLLLFQGNKTIILPEPTNQLELVSLKEINTRCQANQVQISIRTGKLSEEKLGDYIVELKNATNQLVNEYTGDDASIASSDLVYVIPTQTPISSNALGQVYTSKPVIFDFPANADWEEIYATLQSIRENEPIQLKQAAQTEDDPQLKVSQENANHFIAMHGISSIKEEVLKNKAPFFGYFGGIKIDGSYLWNRSMEACQEESEWLKGKGIELIVDLVSEIDLYPNLTWVKELGTPYTRSKNIMDNILAKMEIMKISQIVIGSHMRCEHWSSTTVTNQQSIKNGMKLFIDAAKQKGITVHIQHRSYERYPSRLLASPNETKQLVNGFADTRFAMSLGIASNIQTLLAEAGNKLGMIIYACQGSSDFDLRNPLYKGPYRGERPSYDILPTDVPQILDADYARWEEIINDCQILGWKSQTFNQ